MPKIVDHDQRRADIARAFQQQVAEHGFAATSYARVAAAAGISVGAIQYYFADRQALVAHAFDDLIRTRDARVDDRVEAGERAGLSIRGILDDALLEHLPLDDDRWREHRLGQQLRVEAAQDPDLAALATGAYDALHQRVRGAVLNGTRCGEVAAGVDPDAAAIRIIGATHGVADILALRSPHTLDRRGRVRISHHDVLDPVLGTVFTGECTHHRPRPTNARRRRTVRSPIKAPGTTTSRADQQSTSAGIAELDGPSLNLSAGISPDKFRFPRSTGEIPATNGGPPRTGKQYDSPSPRVPLGGPTLNLSTGISPDKFRFPRSTGEIPPLGAGGSP
ncbi:TetR/AcrR family transcriptional regulator [Nocardioides sp. GXZ039]|uniref:TetR/AcrR family transcriptional regulator n=1 Tax=Nocardioides sp. GXZ039 TaxID=3136018 RepID=UPI0030F3DDE5